MAAALVQQGAGVAIARHHLAHPVGIEQLQLVVLPHFSQRACCALSSCSCFSVSAAKTADPPQIALDVVALDPLADDLASLKQHGAEQPGLFRRAIRFYGVDVAAVGVDDLAAVATAGAKAHRAASSTTTL